MGLATRNLVAPLVKGFTWAIENSTAGGHSIQVIGASGAGVTIASGYTMTVYCDGNNYVTLPSASGGTVLSVTATAPLTSTGGVNPLLALPQANSSVDGVLVAADWSTFNGKQASLGFTPAHSGANSDIASLSGLTTPLSTGQGGSGSAGGTGYRYGNGSAADSYSPTIPYSAITGAPTMGGSQVVFVPFVYLSGSTETGSLRINPNGTIKNFSTTNSHSLIPIAGTVSNLYIGTETAIPSGASIVVTLEDNSSATSLTATISSSSAQASDTTHTVSVSQGDYIQFHVANTNDVSSGIWLTISFVFTIGTPPLP